MPYSSFSPLPRPPLPWEKLSISKQKVESDGSPSPFPAESSSRKEASPFFPVRGMWSSLLGPLVHPSHLNKTNPLPAEPGLPIVISAWENNTSLPQTRHSSLKIPQAS